MVIYQPIISGSLTVTGSVITTAGFTGSLQGTSSYATTASYAMNGGGGGLSGGTTNYIPLWTSATTQATSSLYQSGISIGLGTTSPNTILHISASSAQPLLNIENTTANGYSNMRFTGTGKKFVLGVGNASETTFGVANEFFIYDDSTGTMRMVVDTTGRVGIGTSSPSALLTVNGAFSSSKISDNGSRVLINTTTDNTTDTLQVNGSISVATDLTVSGIFKETVTFNRQTSNYTLALTDRGKLVEMNSGSANILTIPSSSVVNFGTGTKIDVVQYGAGITSITSGSTNVTLRSNNSALRLNGQFAVASLIKVGTDEWYVFGNLVN